MLCNTAVKRVVRHDCQIL